LNLNVSVPVWLDLDHVFEIAETGMTTQYSVTTHCVILLVYVSVV